MDKRQKTNWENKRFCFQCTVAERKALEQLTYDDGDWNMSAMIRRLIREEARRRGFWPPKEEGEETA